MRSHRPRCKGPAALAGDAFLFRQTYRKWEEHTMRLARRLTFTAALLLLLSGTLPTGTVAAQTGDSSQGFGAFKLLRTRNVFDPERRATRTDSGSRPQTLTSRPDYLTLTGTMVSEGKTLAFFTGSR